MTRDVLQHNTKVAAGFVALVAAVTWVVSQVNLLPVLPEKYVALWRIVLASLPVLGVYWAGAMGYGWIAQRLLLKDARPMTVEAAALGLSVLLLLGWFAAWAGVLNRATAWGVPIVGCAVWVTAIVRYCRGSAKPQAWSGASLLWTVGIGVLIVGACCPPGTIWRTEAFGYDVMSYHLQVPREWLVAGQMIELKHNVYSNLSGLFEAGFLHLSWMHGSVRDAIYSCQLLHVSTAVLAAAGVTGIVRRFGGNVAAWASGGVLLVVPWVMVVGTEAYNEIAYVALGAAALKLAFNEKVGWRGGAAAGFLCGAATLCKLPAGAMIAVPVGVILLMRRQWTGALLAAVIGFVTLCPYFARNAAWTGNPVFPLATSTFGMGHWDETLAERWVRGNQRPQDERGDRVEALRRQWLFNTGYGAYGGKPTPRELKNIARFKTEGGIPVLWSVMIVGGLAVLIRRRNAAAVGQLAVMMALQVGFWLVASHLQSRFLIATVLPGTAIVGLGLVELEHALNRKRWVTPFIGSALVAALWIVCFSTMLDQTQMYINEQTGRRENLSPTVLIDSLADFGQHPINDALPAEGVKVYIVADNSRLLFIDRPIVYHSAFDASPLGELIRSGGDVNAGLRAMGVTHVWVHWQELQRLHETYGYDRDVTIESLDRLIATGWSPVFELTGVVTLYALPQE